MLFILQVLKKSTLSLLTVTEISCTGVDIKIYGQALTRKPKTSPLRKVDVGLRG